MKRFTSDFIFSLSDKYQIIVDNSMPAEFLDENYFAFCSEYSEYCMARDISLKKHLIEKPNLFRVFLPWRPYIFDTILQTQWYYDEMVIYDPIFFEINHFKSENNEENKERLRQILIFLFSLKDSITEGFLLFASYDTFHTNKKTVDESKFETLISIPEMREECDRLVEVYKLESTEGQEKSYFQVRSLYRNKQTFFSVVKDIGKLKTEDGFGIYYDLVGSIYTPLTLEEVKEGGFYDRTYNGFKDEYSQEIGEVLNYVDIGAGIKTPILFNRKIDELILSSISVQDNITKSKAIDYYKLFLPFVNGIPADRLFEIREKMPAAFLDFRNLMFEIIYDLEKGGAESDMLELKIQQNINPVLKKLDAEMKNAVTKAKIVGAGLPLVSGLGSLGLWYLGIDVSKYVSLLFGGVSLAELNAWANYVTEKRNGKANSLYYLWKVQRQL